MRNQTGHLAVGYICILLLHAIGLHASTFRYRVVGDTIYDTQDSRNLQFLAEVLEFRNEGVIVRPWRLDLATRKVYEPKVVYKNFSDTNNVAHGESIPVIGLDVGVSQFGNERLRIFDFGILPEDVPADRKGKINAQLKKINQNHWAQLEAEQRSIKAKQELKQKNEEAAKLAAEQLAVNQARAEAESEALHQLEEEKLKAFIQHRKDQMELWNSHPVINEITLTSGRQVMTNAELRAITGRRLTFKDSTQVRSFDVLELHQQVLSAINLNVEDAFLFEEELQTKKSQAYVTGLQQSITTQEQQRIYSEQYRAAARIRAATAQSRQIYTGNPSYFSPRGPSRSSRLR